MKRLLPLILGIVLIAGLVFVNRNMNKGTEVDEDEAAQQQAQKAQEAAQKQPPKQTASPVLPAMSLPAEEVLGNPQVSKYKILFGYTYDAASQANPQVLLGTVNAVRNAVKGRPDVSAILADVDVPAEDRTPAAQAVTQEGLTVNSTPTDPGKLATALKP